jgi:hypothetical protein
VVGRMRGSAKVRMQKSRMLVLSRALPGADDKVRSKHRVAAGRVVKVYIPLPWLTL